MEVQVEPGKYVVAVSGGVDSVSLLHALSSMPGRELIVAHFDHGIRPDSHEDRIFVQKLAERYGFAFTYDEGRLGPSASEATAREARYDFLHRAKEKATAKAIITAHHEDDVLETAIINMLRGTARKGLTALNSRKDITRPLLKVSKAELLDYARQNHLDWREDSTNQNELYLRNYVRRKILPRFSEAARQHLLGIIESGRETNAAVDTLLVKYVQDHDRIDREQFIMLPHEVAREVMAAWLRAYGVRNFDRKTLERLVVAGKVARNDSQFDVMGSVNLKVSQNSLALIGVER